MTLAEHDSRDVTITMKSTIDGTATTGANALAIVDAVAAQPGFGSPTATTERAEQGNTPTAFGISTHVIFADSADANEKQYIVLNKLPDGWSYDSVNAVGVTIEPAVLSGYPASDYVVYEVTYFSTPNGLVSLQLVVNGPADVSPPSASQTVNIVAVAVDTAEGQELTEANSTATASQSITLTVTDTVPTVNAQAAIKVDEDGLPGGNAGAHDDAIGDDPEDDSASQTGNFSITSPVDTITAITLATTVSR